MVGELIGAGAAQEQAVVGETPNLAARLQALADARHCRYQPRDPPAALVGCSSWRISARIHLKRLHQPVAGWRVVGAGRAEGRFEALHGDGSRRWSAAITSSASA